MTEQTADDKPMYEGNWTCADCGAAISKLPFEPNPDKQGSLRCLDCYKKSKPDGQNNPSAPRQAGGGEQKQMHEGNWTCSRCGNTITKLPFEPNQEKLDQLLCLDCFRAGKDQSS